MNEARTGAVSEAPKRHEIRLVGLEQFDEEHRILATYIGQLQEALMNQRPASHVISILRSVHNYAVEHFSHEEAAMESWGYPGIEEHRLEHQVLIARLHRLLDNASVGGVVLSNAVIDVLVEWIMQHVERYDLGYADFYNRGHIRP